jgi:hypothetical protein
MTAVVGRLERRFDHRADAQARARPVLRRTVVFSVRRRDEA